MIKWGFAEKTVFELISVLGLPVIALITGLYFTITNHIYQGKKDQLDAKERMLYQENNELEKYYSNISSLTSRGLGDKRHIEGCSLSKEGERLSRLATAFTGDILAVAGKDAKRRIISFLYSGGLINKKDCKQGVIDSITWVDLKYMDLSGVDFSGLSLLIANFNYANLSNAYFRNSAVGWVNVTGANLSGADFGLTKDFYDKEYFSGLSFGMAFHLFEIDSSTIGNSKTILPISMTYPDHWLSEEEIKRRDKCPPLYFFRPYLSSDFQCVDYETMMKNPNMVNEHE